MGDQLQVKLRKRLEVLLKLPENQVCADCNKRGPRWVSANLGVFVCIECSGIHRNLGVHISFVRSVNLDSWTVKQVEHLEEWGNGRANAYFEANVPSNVKKPVDGDSVRVVEKYIRDKYEHKRFIAKSVPPKVEHRQEEEPAAEPVVRRSSVAKAPVKTIQTPAPVPVAVPPKVVDLLNFENFEAAPPAVPSNSNGFSFMDSNFNNGTPQQQQFQQQPQSGFSAFDEPPRPPPVPASNTDDFMSFVSAPAPGQQQQQQQQQFGFAPPVPPVPAKPQASANDILSLYSNGGGAHHHQMGNGMMRAPGNPMMGGAPHPSHFMNPAGGNQLGGFHPPQHQQFGGMGGFPQQHQQMPQQGQHFGAHQQQQQAPHNPFGALQQQFPGQQQGAPVNPFQQQQQQQQQQQFGQHQHQQQHHQFSQFNQQQPWR